MSETKSPQQLELPLKPRREPFSWKKLSDSFYEYVDENPKNELQRFLQGAIVGFVASSIMLLVVGTAGLILAGLIYLTIWLWSIHPLLVLISAVLVVSLGSGINALLEPDKRDSLKPDNDLV